ncbi:YedE-related selenium metabolism membrane protein [Mobilitalea sibirica]|uniref:YedE-related selenium metabolism membrane protein n=1 Tax=Mobilitalea sibirica TaxID=1462919 RepID=A0A8J7KRU7_9FIRM|nr:YedE family putative selenium transporter [Mobilitalea sibirica]MBH1939651.1 YedE-related selenium metabolism membrane protein [Mobilitalea sibirica]
MNQNNKVNRNNKIVDYFGSRGFMIFVGCVIGFLAPVLHKLGNPDTGLCIACMERDLVGALGFHQAPGGQYIRPEIIGLVLGSTLSAIIFREFKARGGSAPMIRFFLGFFAMIGVLSFTGCPFGTILRLAEGNLNAMLALAGIIGGVFIGVLFIRGGFYLGRSTKTKTAAAFILPCIMVLLFILLVFNIRVNNLSAPFRSWHEPSSLNAPVLISLIAGLVIGFLAQRSRFCTIGGFRDIFLIKNAQYLFGLIAMLITAFLVNLLLGQFHVFFNNPIEPAGVVEYIWSLLGMVLAGLAFTMGGGCAGRQLFLSGEGDTDAAFFVIGMLCGAAVTYNFGLLGRPACGAVGDLSFLGNITVASGLAFCLAIGFTLRIGKGES